MKIYLLWYTNNCDYTELLSVYANEESANTARDLLNDGEDLRYDERYVTEEDVL